MVLRWLGSRTCTVLLVMALLVTAVLLVSRVTAFPMPGNNIGYEPEQPIAFSHRLHAGEMGISCQYCHDGVEKGRHAGIPPTSRCMNCHTKVHNTQGNIQAAKDSGVDAGTSAEILKIFIAQGLNDTGQADPNKDPKPVEWKQIHKVPDFVYFDHSRHVNSGVSCQACHGPVESMERVRQVETLSMGWCMDCHREMEGAKYHGRDLDPTLNCASCHY
jgi:hypothetical protein